MYNDRRIDPKEINNEMKNGTMAIKSMTFKA